MNPGSAGIIRLLPCQAVLHVMSIHESQYVLAMKLGTGFYTAMVEAH